MFKNILKNTTKGFFLIINNSIQSTSKSKMKCVFLKNTK